MPSLYKLREEIEEFNAVKVLNNEAPNEIVETLDPTIYCKNSAKYHRTDRKNDNVNLRNNKTNSFDIPDPIDIQKSNI